MSRITRYTLARAVARVWAMDATQKEHLADQLFQVQPHVFASLSVQKPPGGYPKFRLMRASKAPI
jgi:hypothetical protein